MFTTRYMLKCPTRTVLKCSWFAKPRRPLSSSISLTNYSEYEAINVHNPADNVLEVELNRPDSLNAFNETMWKDVKCVFRQVSLTTNLLTCGVRFLFALGPEICFSSQ